MTKSSVGVMASYEYKMQWYPCHKWITYYTHYDQNQNTKILTPQKNRIYPPYWQSMGEFVGYCFGWKCREFTAFACLNSASLAVRDGSACVNILAFNIQ